MATETEDEARELQVDDLYEIEGRARRFGSIDSKDALAILAHAQWQADEIERLKVRLDPYLDQAKGSPATVPVH
jgi:hypothetical protein